MSLSEEISAQIKRTSESVSLRFQEEKRVLSFQQYLEWFATRPKEQVRDASHYLRDVFNYYKTRSVKHATKTSTRFCLFDLPWEQTEFFEDEKGEKKLPRGALIGQEEVQNEIYRSLSNFVREGKANRLILLHGPNGSAKSTIVNCIFRALEEYSRTEEGALYRFHWVFPSRHSVKSGLGFTSSLFEEGEAHLSSYAHLASNDLDAKVSVEVKDHPLFLLPLNERRSFFAQYTFDEPLSDWITKGELSAKSQQIYDALLLSYRGNYERVLKHVQIERYFISRRYRSGAITIGPEMSVDASERQITMDRNLQSLPPALQSLSLYEAKGELIDAAGGVLEFSDLLKRPLDTFKYLQLTLESGEISLDNQNVSLNCVMIGSANELHLDAFKQHSEFSSFRGRLELIRASYLRNYLEEEEIYHTYVAPQIQRHVAPHSIKMAAMFAVLTRMKRADTNHFSPELGRIFHGLSAFEKMDLYSTGFAPSRLDDEAKKMLQANITSLLNETQTHPDYEAKIGASPREMRTVLLDASQDVKFSCLSPLAVLSELARLCQKREDFEWLQQDSLDKGNGSYHNVSEFLVELQRRLENVWEEELFAASGLVEESRYTDLIDKYIQHVSCLVKGEKFRNKLTGEYEEPDEILMDEVEKFLGVTSHSSQFRYEVINVIAAYAIEYPGENILGEKVFPHFITKLREAFFSDKIEKITELARALIKHVCEDGVGLSDRQKQAAKMALDKLTKRYGYCEHCAVDMCAHLIKHRYQAYV